MKRIIFILVLLISTYGFNQIHGKYISQASFGHFTTKYITKVSINGTFILKSKAIGKDCYFKTYARGLYLMKNDSLILYYFFLDSKFKDFEFKKSIRIKNNNEKFEDATKKNNRKYLLLNRIVFLPNLSKYHYFDSEQFYKNLDTIIN